HRFQLLLLFAGECGRELTGERTRNRPRARNCAEDSAGSQGCEPLQHRKRALSQAAECLPDLPEERIRLHFPFVERRHLPLELIMVLRRHLATSVPTRWWQSRCVTGCHFYQAGLSQRSRSFMAVQMCVARTAAVRTSVARTNDAHNVCNRHAKPVDSNTLP